jgi:hypothetical protein
VARLLTVRAIHERANAAALQAAVNDPTSADEVYARSLHTATTT